MKWMTVVVVVVVGGMASGWAGPSPALKATLKSEMPNTETVINMPIDQHNEIVLVPLGDIDKAILWAMKDMLQKRMGMKFSVGKKVLKMGEPDKAVAPGLIEGRAGTQYDTERLRDLIIQEYMPSPAGSPIRACVGVTKEDLYRGENNFVFGSAWPDVGVMSVYRFSESYTGEKIPQTLFYTRILKQALSSAGFTLEIPRCETRDCARAFPNSLEEHDRKSDELCPVCRKRLSEYLRAHQK